VSQGNFRLHLPSNVRRRWETDEKTEAAASDANNTTEDLAFLSFNTPKDLVWNSEGNVPGNDESVEQATSNRSKQSLAPFLSREKQAAPFWATKGTSCDVEIDVHVSSIMNVRSIITALPSDESESQNIHWRAVPSLREIWQEERRRMARLLEPEHDFLTRQSETNKLEKAPPFTLSVKKGASTPGAKLAAKGMKRLLCVTMGLDKAFMRALKQIVSRHSAAISQVDALLHSESPISRKELSARLMSEHTTSSQLTPTFDEALGARN
jgi:hypothetical protein